MNHAVGHGGASSTDPVYRAAELVGDPWRWMILRVAIFEGVGRFSDFRRVLQIAPKVLSARLGELVAGGLLARRGQGGGAHYALTAMGRDFAPCLLAAQRWGERWGPGRAPAFFHGADAHRFLPMFFCSHCGEPLRSRDVEAVGLSRARVDFRTEKRMRTPDLDKIDGPNAPAIAYTLRAIGDRWSSLVIREAFLGTIRFSQFEERLRIAPNILAERLERLCGLDVLRAVESAEHAGRLVYRLSEKGHDLYDVPLAALTWSERWLSGESEPRLRHKPCGQLFRATFGCGGCGERDGLADWLDAEIPQRRALDKSI